MRNTVLRLARRLYRAAYFSPLRPALEHRLVQDVRARLAKRMDAPHVLAIMDALARAGVRAWVAGGWGVDALVGSQTRAHKDLDLLVDVADAAAAEAALTSLGFRPIPEALPGTRRLVPGSLMPDRLFMRDGPGRMLDVHPVRIAEWPGVASVREPFAVGTIGGRQVDCVSASAQALSHQGYAITDEQRPDLALLERLLHAPADRREPT